MPPLVLASTSPYRKALLQRLGLGFECISPKVDETPFAGESPAELSARLAGEKAREVARRCPGSIVIGSDQVASLDEKILGKPGDFDTARKQLLSSSGKQVDFYTALCVIDAEGKGHETLELFSVHFRLLQEIEIERYLQRDEPWGCAGSFKWEGLGIALFERLNGDDPTALEGLPLIALCSILRQLGLDPLA